MYLAPPLSPLLSCPVNRRRCLTLLSHIPGQYWSYPSNQRRRSPQRLLILTSARHLIWVIQQTVQSLADVRGVLRCTDLNCALAVIFAVCRLKFAPVIETATIAIILIVILSALVLDVPESGYPVKAE